MAEYQKSFFLNAPRGKTEKKLCLAFEKALGISAVGRQDDFFKLGGSDALAEEVARYCRVREVTPEMILSERTPAAIAKKLAFCELEKLGIFRETPQRAPLTASQLGVYLSEALNSGSDMYNIVFLFTVPNTLLLSENQVKQAVNEVLSTHPALYSRVDSQSDPVCLVRMPYPEEGLCEICTADSLEPCQEMIRLDRTPLCRAKAAVSGQEIRVLIQTHHLVIDGSAGQLLLCELRDRLCGGIQPDGETVDSFLLGACEEKLKSGEEYAKSQAWFDNLLSGVDCDSALLYDHPDPRQITLGREQITLSGDEYSLIQRYLSDAHLTPSGFFLGAYGYALAKMCGMNESLFYTVFHGRDSVLSEHCVTMTVRTLPVHAVFDEEKTADEYITAITEQFHGSMNHSLVPFSQIAGKYGLRPEMIFAYQGENIYNNFPNRDLQCDCSVSVYCDKKSYILQAEYRSAKYNRSTIQRFLRLLRSCALSFAKGMRLRDIPLINEEDFAAQNAMFTRLPLEKDATLVSLFRNTAEKYPEKTAVVYKDHSYTYREIDEMTDRIAAYLAERGIGHGDSVAVMITRSEWMVLCSIGIMKAGAIYVPLDPGYPPERLNLMCEDASVNLLIAEKELDSIPFGYSGEKVLTEELKNLPTPQNLPPLPEADDCFILLYTSGTTGKPKGCRILHKGICAFCAAYRHMIGMDDSWHVTSYASYGFDAHMFEIYPAITCGAEVVIIPDEMRLDFPALKNYAEQNEITHLFMTTQVSRQFACEYPEVKHLRYIAAGGEKLVPFELPKSYHFVNLYGPTEGTIAATGMILDRQYDDIPIGRALPNIRLFVVDSFGRRLPTGVPGELVICGAQVAGGYLNRPEQTEKVFVKNIWDAEPEEDFLRCYKTGDIVRLREDGLLEFIGRRDQQVKIRGYRIELSEIEQVIREYPGITDAVAIAVNEGGGKAVHAYIVAGEKVDIESLNRFIRERKPLYMVPSAAMQIDKIPLTVNMKVDKRALPPIERKAEESGGDNRAMTCLEEELFSLVKEIIGHGSFGVETDFLNAGLTSVSSIRLSVQLSKRYGVRIESRELIAGMNLLKLENFIVAKLISKQNAAEPEKPQQQSRMRSYPLTQTQMGIYLDSMRTGMQAYDIPVLCRLPRNTDLDKLRGAIICAVKAHPGMRCGIHPDEKGDIAIYPQENQPVLIEEEQLESLPPRLSEFAFDGNPLYRVRLIHCGEEHYLMLETHHIIADGESLQVLLRDIDSAYYGNAPETESYTAYEVSLDEQAARHSDAFEKAKRYYDSILRDVSADYQLCFDRNDQSRPASFRYELSLDPAQIAEFCRERRVTVSSFFTAAFALTLSRYTAHEDASFATIYNGRDDARTQNLVSMMVKTLPIYLQTGSGLSVQKFLSDTQEQLFQVRKYDLYSFADAARDYGVKADTMFIYQGKIMQDVTFLGEALHETQLPDFALKSELSFELYEQDHDYRLNICRNAGHYSEELIRSFAEAFLTAAKGMLSAEKLGGVGIASDEAMQRFEGFNDTAMEVPQRPVYRAFEEAADRDLDRIAVRDSVSELSYARLDRAANALACQMHEKGIPSGGIAEVIVNRVKEVYVGQLGALKAGCAFMCLSPDYPDDRISYVSADAKADCVITTHAVYDRRAALFESLALPVFFADDVSPDADCARLELAVNMNALCYLIYTSGSTGKPKGVMVSQRNVINMITPGEKNRQLRLYTEGPAVCSAVTAFTFDASIYEGLVSLCNGCTVCIASEDEIHNPVLFRKMILKNGVTSIVSTPSFLMNMLDYEPFSDAIRQMKVSICGGESYPERLYKKLRALNPSLTLINSYGPSEATVTCSYKVLTSSGNITIGVPNNNTQLLMLDKAGHPLPMGALGEMVILGDGVGLGYLNRPDLTEKSFITLLGKRAYKTGDLSLITHEGEIEYHGRIDNQVKLRGLRVELGEIESAINAVPQVKTSIVTVHGDESSRYLAAYYTAECELSADTVREAISKTLSDYMVPRILIQLEEMPLTVNGKIDKRALPSPQMRQNKEYEAPATREEQTLCEIFGKVLRIARVGVNDDFFELGGTSLTATKVAMLSMAAGLNIVYSDIFQNPTVRKLSRLKGISEQNSQTEQNDFHGDYSAIDGILSRNRYQPGDEPGERPLGGVLLTGATGFLGMHVLARLLETEGGDIYCLIRKGAFTSPEVKLIGMFIYYFGFSIESEIGRRVHCIEGDITDRGLSEKLRDVPFETLINCAACVKHFSNDDTLERVNVLGVDNLIRLCRERDKRLIHISTISVAGEGKNGEPAPDRLLHETELYFGQWIENQYINSKFRAERNLLAAIADGLDGKIMRAGNLMPRKSDGEFQINFMTNGFMRTLHGYCALGCAPYSVLDRKLEFSPIDETAAVILALSRTNQKYSVFHVNNTHHVYLYDVIRAMNDIGLRVEPVTEEVFAVKLKNALRNAEKNDAVSGLIAYLNHEDGRYQLGSDNLFTQNVLSRIGCRWSITDESYLRGSLLTLRDMGFFDLPL